MEDEITKNKSGRYAPITLYEGRMKVREWQTRGLNPDFGDYFVTAPEDSSEHRLVVRPRDGGVLKEIDFSGSIIVSRVDGKGGRFVMTFERGLLIKGPSPELDQSNRSGKDSDLS
jgi:hypothetical protein